MLLSFAMNRHRSRSVSAARLPSPSWGSLRRRNRAYPLLEWFSLVLFLSVVLGTSVVDACGYGAGDSLYDVCAESASFCFRSTLKGFGSPEEGNCQEPCFGARESGLSAEWRSGNAAAFKMADGGMASCRLVDTDGGLGDGLSSGLKNSGIDDVGSCMASLVPDVWTKTSSAMTADFVDRADAINSDILNGSSLNIDITPPFLDWGEHSLYTPSIAFLTVKNTFDNSVLDVYDPYSTDAQFYSYGFEKLVLAPGESASIAFVFLPRWLGSSAAHIVLQTSCGGFIIQARGVAVESPYKIEPLVGTNVPSSKRLTWNLSFYNPFSEAIHMEVVSAWVSLPGHRNQSVHVVCGLDPLQQPSAELDNILADDEWFRVESSKLGVRWLDIRPHNRWQVPAQETQLILEIRLWPYTQGNILGAICFKIRKFSDDKLDTVVLPLEINVHPKTNYSTSTDSVFVDIEPLQPCKEKETVLIISFRNDGLDLLSLMNISEVTKSSKLFKVRYMEGLLLFPGTSTKIAMISYADHVNSKGIASAIPGEHLECQLLIVTNGSASSVIKIPCLDLVHVFSSGAYGSGVLASDDAYNDGRLSPNVERNNVNAIRTSLQGTSDASLPNKLLEAYEADEVILKNWRSQGTGASVSVLEEQELLFPVVPVGTHFSKWFSVHNPSQQPVMMQFLLNSGDIIDQCKSADELYDHTFSSRFTEIDSPETRIGFSIPVSAITEALLHPSESALFGPVIFRPSNRCMWRSSALIRNNLSGVEWFPVRAFGGSHLLIILEESEAVWKLEFNFHLPINMSSANSLSDNKNTSSLCNHRLSKEIYAKNIGELPLEVKKLKVSGTDCGLDGFMLHRCKGFTLEPGESIRLLISYEADFSADVVHRDLELALATGIFVIPMKASIPLHMLNLCKKTFFQAVYWKVSLLAFVAVSTLLLLIRILPRFIFLDTEECYVEANNTTSKAAKSSGFQNTAKFSRLSKKDKIPQAEFFNNYHVGEHVFDNSEKVQEKQDFGQLKEIEPLPSALASKPVEVFDKYNMLETPQGGLTVRIKEKEKGRRRKRRITGTGLAGKLEVSSSQSGNSTPSSPLSPNAYTPKQAWPLSPESEDAQFAGLSPEQRHQKEHNANETMPTRTSEAARHSQRASMMLNQKQSPSPKSTGKPTSTPPAKFPASGWPAPTAAAPSVSAVHSPIAPYARAPGPKSSKDKTIEMNKNDGGGKELTYNIWGNYFSDNFLVRQREMTTEKPDASEGDSQSLFARDPQSLMMMPSAWPLPPGQNLPYDNVTYLNQMN